MSVDNWIELVRLLGIATPLVALLGYLLREATRERQDITSKFLEALRTTVEQSNETRIRSANELAALTHTLNEHQVRSQEEHEKIIRVLERLENGRWSGRERRTT